MILVSDIIRHTSRVFGVPVDLITGERRWLDVVRARQAVCKLARELTKQSWPEIGRRLGGRDHSTAIHGHKVCIIRMRHDPVYAAKVRLVGKLAKRGAPFEALEWTPPDEPVDDAALAARFAAKPKPRQWRVPANLLPIPDPPAPWWTVDDDTLLTEAVQAFQAGGGTFVEVWS